MQKTHDIEINENDDIFKNDLLDRKSEIENLTPIVLNFNDPLVLALDSPWGTGKTTFVKLWQAHLKQEGKQSIYFNAWETDFAEDPLIVLVSELNKWLKSCNESVASTFLEKSKKILPSITKQAAIGLTKALTLIGVDSQEVERVISEAMGNITGDLIDNFNKQSEAIQQFKEIIEEALKALPDEQKNLVIFIDELDRCRPTYAIELLERIKHLFSIERLVFVLSTDTTQLSHSICAVYGNNFDAKKYLQRFIDLDYAIQEPKLEQYIKSQLEALGINKILESRKKWQIENRRENKNIDENKELDGSITLLINQSFAKELKLRDINVTLMRICLVLYSIPIDDFLDAPLIATLIILRDRDKELYNKYVQEPSAPAVADEVINYLFRYSLPVEKNNYDLARIIGYLIHTAHENTEVFENLIKIYRREGTTQFDYDAIEAVVNTAINPRFNNYPFRDNVSFNRIVERIEFLQKINL